MFGAACESTGPIVCVGGERLGRLTTHTAHWLRLTRDTQERGKVCQRFKDTEEKGSADRSSSPCIYALGLQRPITSDGQTTRDDVRRVCVCVCVCAFIKLHITAQSGPVILVILCHSH